MTVQCAWWNDGGTTTQEKETDTHSTTARIRMNACMQKLRNTARNRDRTNKKDRTFPCQSSSLIRLYETKRSRQRRESDRATRVRSFNSEQQKRRLRSTRWGRSWNEAGNVIISVEETMQSRLRRDDGYHRPGILPTLEAPPPRPDQEPPPPKPLRAPSSNRPRFAPPPPPRPPS